MNNLPPGVNEGMIPGNRQEDHAWDDFLEWADSQLAESGLSVEDCRAAVKAGIEMVQKAIELQNIPEVVPDEQAIKPDPEEEESFVVPLSVTLKSMGFSNG
jgi:hypothetical protein